MWAMHGVCDIESAMRSLGSGKLPASDSAWLREQISHYMCGLFLPLGTFVGFDHVPNR